VEKDVLDAYKKAGSIAATCLREGAKLIVPGASMRDVLDRIEARIKELGGSPAFPAQIALNSIAAHYCPTDRDDVIFKEGDIAKLDIGVHVNGFVADTATTVNLGAHDDLLRASKEALRSALALIRPGVTLGEIGRTIQETIRSFDLRPIHNLSGHGLDRYEIHTAPNIPNVDTKDSTTLEEGMVIAIEPFATTGAGSIFESNNPTIFSLIAHRGVRSPFTRDVLKTIQSYHGLPFTTRWLTRKHGEGKVSFALRELSNLGMLVKHPPLPDKDGGLVSQHEHSVIVAEKPLVYTLPSDE